MVPQYEEYKSLAAEITTTAELLHAYQVLADLNMQIWDAIDDVMAFDLTVLHKEAENVACITMAQTVQRLNSQRTNVIRKIDQLCSVESTVPEKVHKLGGRNE